MHARLFAGVMLCLVVLSSPADAGSGTSSPVPSAVPVKESAAMVAVRRLDPRFQALDNHEVAYLRAGQLGIAAIYAASWIRELPTMDASPAWEGPDFGRLIEVMMVSGCDPDWSSPAATDPCEWRHVWLYRVRADGEATLLFEAGPPEEQ